MYIVNYTIVAGQRTRNLVPRKLERFSLGLKEHEAVFAATDITKVAYTSFVYLLRLMSHCLGLCAR